MSKESKDTALVAYVPVIHRGYLDIFHEHSGADMHILDQDIIDDFDYLRKDIRALTPEESRSIVEAMQIFPTVKLLGKSAVEGAREQYDKIVMPQDDISRQLQQEYFPDSNVEFEPVFLRWDRENSVVNKDVKPDRVVHAGRFEDQVVNLLYEEAGKATSWWRRVGAALIVNEEVVFSAHNTNRPTEYSSYIDGDPRSALKRGVGLEITNDQHAEPILIGWCARNPKISSEGATIFVDTYPCPKCAKDIVSSGIGKVYFIEGYAVTDAQEILKTGGVETIKILTDKKPPAKGSEWKPYPQKR